MADVFTKKKRSQVMAAIRSRGTRARLQWRQLGVDGLGIADAAPEPTFPEGKMPRLTVPPVARIQSFPDE